MSDDVQRRLDEAGRRDVPQPEPAFADALEARLLAVAASLPPVPPPPPRRRIAARRWIAATGVAVALVTLVAVAGVGLPGRDPSPAPRPALAAAVNVEVALADGTVLEDPDGLLLPEGAVITVGEGGSARIGETELGPGDVARVEGGRLRVQRASPAAVIPARTPAGTRRPEATPGPTAVVPTERPPSATPSPTPQPTGSPSPTREPTPQPAPTDPPATARPSPTPTPTPAILRPRLRARLIDGPRIAARWTATWGAASYVLVATASRSGAAPDPVYPGSRVIGEFTTPPDRAVRFRVRAGVVQVRLMVVALRDNGRVLRRSRIVTITIPLPGDTTGSDATASPTASFAPPPSPSPSP